MASSSQVAMSGLGLKTQVAVGDGSVTVPSIGFSNDANTGLYRPGADVVGVVTGGVERMRVDAAGNVGIGVTSPAGALHVQGSDLLMFNATAPRIRVGMSIDSNCTIGYATGAGNFSTNAGLGDCIIRNNESNKKIHMQAGVGAAVITVTNQSVGIGSTSPQATLDVAGNVRMNRLGTGLNWENLAYNVTYNGPAQLFGNVTTSSQSGHYSVRVTMGMDGSSVAVDPLFYRIYDGAPYQIFPIIMYIPPGYWATITNPSGQGTLTLGGYIVKYY